MRDGTGSRWCRWFGHKLAHWNPRWKSRYPWWWPADRYIGGFPTRPEQIVCVRCENRYVYDWTAAEFGPVTNPGEHT